jgi:hypothetical protein
MDPSELLERLARTLEALRIPYLITGSMATIAYGEPRFTNDIDVVVRLASHQVDELCRAFPAEEFYISREAVADAVAHRAQFNVLHPTSGLKIDVIVADDSEFNQARFSRARSLRIAAGRDVTFASPEDVIIKKLVFNREGGSEKHLRDISGVLKIMGDEIDRAYIERWVQRLGLTREWSSVTQD